MLAGPEGAGKTRQIIADWTSLQATAAKPRL